MGMALQEKSYIVLHVITQEFVTDHLANYVKDRIGKEAKYMMVFLPFTKP